MASPTPASVSAELKSSGLDRFLEVGGALLTSWTGRLVAYLTAVTAVLATYGKLAEQAQLYLPNKTPGWVLPVGLAGLFLIVGCLEGIPAIIAQNRKRRRVEISSDALKAGYFQLGPRQAGSEFIRADNKHVEILAWLQQTEQPVVYVTGKSGCGKSSLLEAWVIPHLQGGPSAPLVLKLRGYQDPVQMLERELQRPGLIWQEPPGSEPGGLSALLQLACRKLGPRRFFVVCDQFEEFVILRSEEQRAAFTALLASLTQRPVAGLTLLLVLRSDYLGLLDNLALPKLLQDANWKHIPPFTENDARTFLRNSGLQIDEEVLQAVLQEAADLEQTRGLIRPITVNLCGLVLGRFAGGLPRRFRPGAMIRGFLRESVSLPEIREISPKIVPRMISPQLTKYPRSVAALVKDTGLAELDVRTCLWTLGQRERGVVRPLDSQQENWEISHDFLVPLLDSIFARWTVSLWRRLNPWFPWVFASCVAAAALAIATSRQDPGIMLRELGWTIRQPTPTVVEVSFERNEQQPPYEKSATALAGLKVSVQLSLPHGSISGIRGLRYAKNIKYLNLRNRPDLNDLTPIAELTSLNGLDLSNDSSVTSLEPIRGLTNLTKLDLYSASQVTSLEPLSALTNLTWLRLYGNYEVTGLEPLKRLKKLTELQLSYPTKVTSLEPLRGLTNLTKLDLDGAREVTSLEPLKGLTQLTELNVRGAPRITSLEPLEGLTKLTVLGLGGDHGITSLEPLKGLANLTELTLYKVNGITSLEPLKGLTKLAVLYLGRASKVKSLEPIKGLTELTVLDLSNEPEVDDLRPLSGLTNLRELNLKFDSGVKSLEPLAGLVSLETIDIRRTGAVRLSPLLQIRTLKSVSLDESQVSADDIKVLRSRGVLVFNF